MIPCRDIVGTHRLVFLVGYITYQCPRLWGVMRRCIDFKWPSRIGTYKVQGSEAFRVLEFRA